MLWLLVASLEAGERIRALALFEGKALLEIDGRQLLLREGAPPEMGVRLVSASAESAVVEVDGQQTTLALDNRIGAEFRPAERATVRLVPGEQGHYFVDGQINGRSVRFLVDTGATGVAINQNLADQIGIRYEKTGRPGKVNTAGGSVSAYGVRFDSVQIQGIKRHGVEGVVIEGDTPLDALLGQSFLNRLDIRKEGAVLELRER